MASLIDPTKPADGVPAVKADLRANLQAAKDEIEALQAGGTALPAGGAAGQRLTKLSAADFDVGWESPAPGASTHMVFAKDFGAVADGQDRRTELQAAIDAASGKTLVIEGMISIGGDVRFAQANSGTTVVGAGPAGHGIRAHNPDNIGQSQLLRVEGSDEANPITDVSFQSIEVDGNRAEASTTAFSCVTHRHARNVRWQNCYIHDNPSDGRTLFEVKGNCSDFWLVGNRFWNAGRNAIGTFAQSTTNHPNTRIFILGNSISVGLLSGETERNGILVSSAAAFSSDVSSVMIQGNYIFDCPGNDGIRLGGNNFCVIDGNTFKNNHGNIRSTPEWNGIENHNVISNNRFLSTIAGSGKSHITLRHPKGFLVIEGNAFEPSDNGKAIQYIPDTDLSDDAGLIIKGNVCRETLIEVNRPGGSPLQLVVQGNIINSVTGTNGIEVNNVDSAIVTGNAVDGSGTNGILLSNLDKPICALNSVTGTWTAPIAQSSVTNEVGIASGLNQT